MICDVQIIEQRNSSESKGLSTNHALAIQAESGESVAILDFKRHVWMSQTDVAKCLSHPATCPGPVILSSSSFLIVSLCVDSARSACRGRKRCGLGLVDRYGAKLFLLAWLVAWSSAGITSLCRS